MKEQEAIWKATNKGLLARVERMSKYKAKKEEEHDQEIEDVIVELKRSVSETIWKQRSR